MPIILVQQATYLLNRIEETEDRHDTLTLEYQALKASRVANPRKLDDIEKRMNAAWHEYANAQRSLDNWCMARNVWIHPSQNDQAEQIRARIRDERKKVLDGLRLIHFVMEGY